MQKLRKKMQQATTKHGVFRLSSYNSMHLTIKLPPLVRSNDWITWWSETQMCTLNWAKNKTTKCKKKCKKNLKLKMPESESVVFLFISRSICCLQLLLSHGYRWKQFFNEYNNDFCVFCVLFFLRFMRIGCTVRLDWLCKILAAAC